MGFRKILVSLPCGSVAAVFRFLKSCEFRNKSGHVEKLVCDLTTVVGLHDFVRRSRRSPAKPIDYFKIAIVRQPYGSCNHDAKGFFFFFRKNCQLFFFEVLIHVVSLIGSPVLSYKLHRELFRFVKCFKMISIHLLNQF